MKVLYISRRFYPEVIGGGQVSGLFIAKSLKAQGCEVYVCTFTEGKYRELDIDGVKIFQIPIKKLNFSPRLSNMDFMYFEMAIHASKIIDKVRPDVIHLLNFESIPGAAIYYKLKYKIPIYATVNGPGFGCFVQSAIDYKEDICIKCRVFKRYFCSKKYWGLKGNLYYIYSLWYMGLLRLSYNYVDKFFAVSHAMVPVLTNIGVKEKNISIIYNPIEPMKIRSTGLKKKLGIENKKIILFIGRLTKAKGVENVIKSMVGIDNAIYLVVGKKTNDYNEFQRLVDNLGLNDKVLFTDYVDHKEIVEYYSIADVCVLVERFYEPLSRFLLEATVYGVPIITNDVGSNKEVAYFNKKINHIVKYGNIEELRTTILKVLKSNKKGVAPNFLSPEIIGKKIYAEYNSSKFIY